MSGYTNSLKCAHPEGVTSLVPSHPTGHPEHQGLRGKPLMSMGYLEISAVQPISVSPESILGAQPREAACTR